MSAVTGIVKIGNYAGAANDAAAVQILIDLLGDPDETKTSGRAAGSNLDEISPMARAQLRVELLALQDAVDTTNTL